MKKEDFLTEFREQPRREFASSLYERLAARDAHGQTAPSWAVRLRPAFAGAAALATLVMLFSFPAVRAATQDFLDLFRVKRFVAVPVDPARVAQLRAGHVGIESLLGDSVEELIPRTEPVRVGTS